MARCEWMRLRQAALGLTLLVGSCQPPPPPYSGLTDQSYGPLVQRAPTPCDPEHDGGAVDEFALGLTQIITSPLKGLDQVDQSLRDEGVADKFRFAGDPNGFTVAIITHDDDHVLFWFMLDLVKPREVDAAAAQFCQNRQRSSRWVGSSQQCAPPHPAPFAINGQQIMMRPTYVLSEYTCPAAGRAAPRRARAARPSGRH